MPETTFGFVMPVIEKDAHWFAKCLDAVHLMDPMPNRVVVVANGPGPFLGIERAMKDSPIYRHPETRMGYIEISSCPVGSLPFPHAINRGIEQMGNMEWVAMLSADDAPLPHYYADLLSGLAQMPDADVISVGAQAMNESGDRTCMMPAAPMVAGQNPQILGTSPFRRNMWVKVGGLDETTPIFDGAFWIDCIREGAKVKVMPGVSWLFRERPDSFSRTMIYPQREALWADVLKRHPYTKEKAP